jgi:hypothetical protein
MIKTKKILKLGCFVYNLKNQFILINCDQLLFLKKYKNIADILEISLYENRIYSLIYKLLKYRVKHL